MRCAVCRNGETKPGKSVITLTRETSAIVFRNVPADVCRDCNEEYISEEITKLLLITAENSFEKGVALGVKDWNNLPSV